MKKNAHPIPILLVDDHTILREGLEMILNNQPDLEVVGTAGTAADGIARFAELRPEVLVLDLQLPDGSGSDVTETLCRKFPEANILILTTYDGDEDIYRAIAAGAKGYLLKDAERAELLEAVRTVAQGRRYLSRIASAKLAGQVGVPRLTERELEIVRCIAQGQLNKQIASELGISEGTVKSHIAAAMEKLGVRSRTEVAMTAKERGIIGR